MAASLVDGADLALASPEEEESVIALRRALEPELAQLAADGLDWPHTTGDLFMLRVFRGNNSNVEESVVWYRDMIALRAQYGLDDVHRRCEAESIRWAAAAMPHAKENLRYVTTVFDEESMITPNGHLFYYDALGDVRTAELVSEVGVERWLEFMKFTTERRTSVLDRLSRERQSIVKLVRVIDLEGASVGPVRAYFQLVKQHLAECMKGTTIEVMHRLYVINFPRWAQVLYHAVQRILPARVIKRIRIHGKDFLQDPEFARDVGAELIARVQAMRTRTAGASWDDGAPEGARCVIPAGQVLERMLELQAGSRASWEFRVGSAAEGGSSSRGLFGWALDATRGEDSTLTFSATFTPAPSDGCEMRDMPGEPVEAARVLCPADGAQSGTMVADRAGLLLLSWSNSESYVRAKMLSSFKVGTTGAEAG